MCGIFSSFDKEKFKELYQLNKYRGTFSYSLNLFGSGVQGSLKGFGVAENFDIFFTAAVPDSYFIGHTQAPTNGLVEDMDRIHPAKDHNTFLFHNGILKDAYVKELQKIHGVDIGWDTLLMLKEINTDRRLEWILSKIDGSFAAVYIVNDKIYVFRNNPGVLYIDDFLNISSTPFGGAKLLPSETIFSLDLDNKKTIVEGYFKSKSNPYYIPGD